MGRGKGRDFLGVRVTLPSQADGRLFSLSLGSTGGILILFTELVRLLLLFSFSHHTISGFSSSSSPPHPGIFSSSGQAGEQFSSLLFFFFHFSLAGIEYSFHYSCSLLYRLFSQVETDWAPPFPLPFPSSLPSLELIGYCWHGFSYDALGRELPPPLFSLGVRDWLSLFFRAGLAGFHYYSLHLPHDMACQAFHNILATHAITIRLYYFIVFIGFSLFSFISEAGLFW